MINYVVYGHTSYLDILRVQSDYVSVYDNLTLFINKNDLEMDDVYSKYGRVIFYDDSKPYASRLIECLNQIDDEYFLMLHDIDILLNVDEKIVGSFYDFMRDKNVDRVDLKQSPNLNSSEILTVGDWKPTSYVIDGIYLVKQDKPSDYIYNVNPSIWKRESFLRLLNTFPNKTYRDIEGMDVQNFCLVFNVYKLYTNNPLQCGYFQCLPIFTYLHISHSSRLLILNPKFETAYGQPYGDVGEEYIKIVDKYNLKSSSKWVTS